MTRKERYQKVLSYFAEAMPDAQTELHYDSVFHLLIAVMLSAQCTDKRVNLVTPALFKAFPSVSSLAVATPQEVFSFISSVSYPNSKSEYLVQMAQHLLNHFNGEIPKTVDELQQLPGVGRKTANVLVSVAFGQPAMPVDTHVFRVANRIGLTLHSKTPLETEHTLVANIPPELLGRAHHWLILHGRYVCQSRRPHCQSCGISAYCKEFSTQQRKLSHKQ